MLILGIDPGSRFTGWGLVHREQNRYRYHASGFLRLSPGHSLSRRLLALSEGIEAVLEAHSPACCAVEQIFTAHNARSALVLGQARGVILCAVERRGLPLHEYTASQVKQAVVGTGRAGKEQVQRMVGVLLGLRGGIQEDEADALAVALTHAAASRLAALK